MAKLVSKVYGEALFELARENDSIREVWDEIKALSEILKSNEEFGAVMEHPSMTVDEKRNMIAGIFK